MSEQYVEKLSELADYWNHIEERLKQAEQHRGDVVHAAVNELRYAGRALIDAWHLTHLHGQEDHSKELNDKLVVAGQYLMNANHDITDGICFFFNQKIKDLLEHYPRKRIRKDFANLDEFLDRMDSANAIVTQSRKSRPHRKELYERLENEYIPYLLDQYKLLNVAERMALARQRRARYIAIVSVAFGIIGFIGSIASILSLNGQCDRFAELLSSFSSIENNELVCKPAAEEG